MGKVIRPSSKILADPYLCPSPQVKVALEGAGVYRKWEELKGSHPVTVTAA